ncbi:MAG TPA: hypothetical protein PKA64_11270 [Myxococcota bacterium]|nr:hypothetical protein [Myxococcota bacterium]
MWFPLWLAACGVDPSGGSTVLPEAGTWAYEDGGVLSSTCPDDLYTDPDAQFIVSEVREGSFVVDDGLGEPFGCTVDGRAFTCPVRHAYTYAVPMADATVLYDVAVAGLLHGPRSLEGTQTFSLDCEGGSCALGAVLLGVDLPCSYEVAFTAER